MRLSVKDIIDLLELNPVFNRLSEEDRIDAINYSVIEIYKLIKRKPEWINWNAFTDINNEIVESYEYDHLIDKHQLISKLSTYTIDELNLEELKKFPITAVNLLIKLASRNIVKLFEKEFRYETIQAQLYLQYSSQPIDYNKKITIKLLEQSINDKVFDKVLKSKLVAPIDGISTLSYKEMNFRLTAPITCPNTFGYHHKATAKDASHNLSLNLPYILAYRNIGAVNISNVDYSIRLETRNLITTHEINKLFTYTINWGV